LRTFDRSRLPAVRIGSGSRPARRNDNYFSNQGISGPGRPEGRAHAIRPACRMMLRIMSGKMKAWNGSMEYQ
jgi:hypothetical protein